MAHVLLRHGVSFDKHGTVNPLRMDRGIGEDVLTLSYNPKEGTMHGAYNMEPAILLHDNIPPGKRGPLQPFVALGDRSSTVTIVNNPHDMQ